MVDLNKVKIYTSSWLDSSSTQYDNLIEDIILSTKSFVNEIIGWRYAPEAYSFKSILVVSEDNRIYLDKLPVTSITSLTRVNGEGLEFTDLDNANGILSLNNNVCGCFTPKSENSVVVEYVVGGIVDDYPIAVNEIILQLVLKKLNHTINNANGFNSLQIGGDINLQFKYELTQEQEKILKAYKC